MAIHPKIAERLRKLCQVCVFRYKNTARIPDLNPVENLINVVSQTSKKDGINKSDTRDIRRISTKSYTNYEVNTTGIY